MQPKPEPPAKEPIQNKAPEFTSGAIRDVIVRDLSQHGDDRGWLSEMFRKDELADEFHPAMCYVSMTLPNVQRGPHEHVEQADFFCFLGPSTFKMRLWDNRPDSETYRHVMTLFVGEEKPSSVLVPKGVVHAYKNVGNRDGIVLNFPNRLYKGERRREEIDEIRHEDDPETIFRVED